MAKSVCTAPLAPAAVAELGGEADPFGNQLLVTLGVTGGGGVTASRWARPRSASRIRPARRSVRRPSDPDQAIRRRNSSTGTAVPGSTVWTAASMDPGVRSSVRNPSW